MPARKHTPKAAPATAKMPSIPGPKTRKPRTQASKEAALEQLAQQGRADAQAEADRLQRKRDANRRTAAKPKGERLSAKEATARWKAAGDATLAAQREGVDAGDGEVQRLRAKRAITAHKLKLMATTGMTPLEFLTAVYRNQLYTAYDVEVVDASKGLAQFYPKIDPVTGELDCALVELKIEQRIAAATAAAPYVHRKKPIGIDGGEGKPLAIVTADRLAQLSDDELDKLLTVFGKLGVGAEFEGGAQRPYSVEDEGEDGQ